MSETYVPSPDGKIKAKELEFKAKEEHWNIYELEDGTVLKARLIATKIARGIDPTSEGTYYLPNGEPLYNIRHTVVVSARVPIEMLKEPEEGK